MVKMFQHVVMLAGASAGDDAEVFMLQMSRLASVDGPALAQTIGTSRCTWSHMKKDMYIGGCSKNCQRFPELVDAKLACAAETTCGGVTLEHGSGGRGVDLQWELRSGPKVAQTPQGKGEISFVCETSMAKRTVEDVCIHARGDKPATFSLPGDMRVSEVIFTRKSGGLTCRRGSHRSNFGCDHDSLGLVITEKDKKKVLMPLATQKVEGFKRMPHKHAHWYKLQGVGEDTLQMKWKFGMQPVLGDGEYELWYNEDLTNGAVGDNAGTACYDIEILGSPAPKPQPIVKPPQLLIPGSIVALKGGKDGKYCADEGGNRVKCNRGHIKAWEMFTVVDAGHGKIALKGGKDGKMCADEGPQGIICNRGHIKAWEMFTVVDAGNEKIALKGGKDGRMCADEGNKINCNRGHVRSWEKFTVTVVRLPAPKPQVRLPPPQFNVVADGCKGFKNVKEDCTNKDLFILKTNTKGFVAPTFKPDQYDSDEVWATVKVQESEWKSTCVAYVHTGGGTCKTFCESNGKKCVRAMDDAHHQTAGLSKWLKTGGYDATDCTLLPSGHTRQSQKENGCNQKWGTQMCACN